MVTSTSDLMNQDYQVDHPGITLADVKEGSSSHLPDLMRDHGLPCSILGIDLNIILILDVANHLTQWDDLGHQDPDLLDLSHMDEVFIQSDISHHLHC